MEQLPPCMRPTAYRFKITYSYAEEAYHSVTHNKGSDTSDTVDRFDRGSICDERVWGTLVREYAVWLLRWIYTYCAVSDT